jgi:hypothetical protein
MEPYRPYVDELVVTFVEDGEDFTELTTSIKKQLLIQFLSKKNCYSQILQQKKQNLKIKLMN